MSPAETEPDVTIEPGGEDNSTDIENDESVTVIVNNVEEESSDDDSAYAAELAELRSEVADLREKFAEVKGILEGIAAAAEAEAEAEPESAIETAPDETVIEDEAPATEGGEQSEEVGVGLAGERHAGIWI